MPITPVDTSDKLEADYEVRQARKHDTSQAKADERIQRRNDQQREQQEAEVKEADPAKGNNIDTTA